MRLKAIEKCARLTLSQDSRRGDPLERSSQVRATGSAAAPPSRDNITEDMLARRDITTSLCLQSLLDVCTDRANYLGYWCSENSGPAVACERSNEGYRVSDLV
eukprot:482691-Hanusia_phi.AAC.1